MKAEYTQLQLNFLGYLHHLMIKGFFVHNFLEGEAEVQMSYAYALSLSCMRVIPLDFCLRVIVNEKTTSSILSVIVN